MKRFNGILLTLLSLSLNAQPIVKGIVLDQSDHSPIPFVNIGVKENARGTVSNGSGAYELKLKSLEDKVVFSSIGYEEVTFLGKELSQLKEVKLVPKDYNIEQIEVDATRFSDEEKIFGVRNETRGMSVGFGSQQLGAEIGAFIDFKKETLIKSVNFVLNHAKGDSMLFRVNIYTYIDGKVGEKLLKENLFLSAKQRKGTHSLDMSNYNLIIDHPVLLTLEWVYDDNGAGNMGLTFDTKKTKKMKGIQLRYSSLGDIKALPLKKKHKPCFYFIGKEVE